MREFPKPIIGLIGAIGAGKSAVAAALAKRGGVVVDADKLGHEVLELPDVKHQLTARWGAEVLKDDGTVNRRTIGSIVFQDLKERHALEAIVFPAIRKRAEDAITKLQADDRAGFIVLDAAVMLEAGWHDACNKILFVDAPRELRAQRLAARSGWTEPELALRESAQLPLDVKRARADVVIMNDGSLEELQNHVDRVLTSWN